VNDVITHLAAQPGATLAVTSGGVIAVACARVLGLPASRWPDLARILVNTGLTKVISGQSGMHLLSFNDHAHLAPRGGPGTCR
jgi:broad specificity phosphatase PhoE